MKKLSFSACLLALAAVPLASGQTFQNQDECSAFYESYYDNLPGCVNPPANEEECRAFADERSRNAYILHNANILKLQTLRDEALGVSADIREDELSVYRAIRDERMRDLNAGTATAIASAKALFYSCCLAAAALPTPADAAAVAKCIGWHALKMSAILTNHNIRKNSIEDQWNESYGRIDAEAKARDRLIEIRMTKSSNRESVRYEMQTSLIATDLELCLARVNND